MSLPPLISADSHIAEHEECFADIDPKFREQRPREIYDEQQGALLHIPGIEIKVPMGIVCTAGRPPEKFKEPVPWSALHPAGHDPKARLAVQDEEGVLAEVLYPSLGMVMCNLPDPDYKKACFDAYNRWLQGFCEPDPNRLVGVGMAAVRTVEEGLDELVALKEAGFRGVMLPGDPVVEDYDHACYDPFWERCIDLGLPVSFHILTGKSDITQQFRGPAIVQQIVTIRGVQNLMMMFVLSGVFERHPDLRVVCVESDAGWVPHFSFRMDHAFDRHRHWMEIGKLTRKPSDYMRENVYTTFQDDYSVKAVIDQLNPERVMWATDFPHSDGTYPYSRDVAASVTEGMTDTQRNAILHGNAAALYGLEI